MADLENRMAMGTMDTRDEANLAKLGYKQELKREWSLLQVSNPIPIQRNQNNPSFRTSVSAFLSSVVSRPL
jgi:hypothetical protein